MPLTENHHLPAYIVDGEAAAEARAAARAGFAAFLCARYVPTLISYTIIPVSLDCLTLPGEAGSVRGAIGGPRSKNTR